MKTIDAPRPNRMLSLLWCCLAAGWLCGAQAQALLNVDFGVGSASLKTGFAATGQSTNDFWNLHSHYRPKFSPEMALVADGRTEGLKFADGSPSTAAVAVTNAPGVWGNATGDPMLDSYLYAPNGSNLIVSLTGLAPGRYHFYLYGWAAADGSREQTSTFIIRSGTNTVGPLNVAGALGWQAGQTWREGAQFVVGRDVPVEANQAVVVEVVPGGGGVAVLNGLQIISRGTRPPALAAPPTVPGETDTNLVVRSVSYAGQVASGGARFAVKLEAESRSTNEVATTVFTGDVALLEPKLPPDWWLLKKGPTIELHAKAPGTQRLEFELVARVARSEPWDIVRFSGPAAAVGIVTAQSAEPNLELQLLSGTPVETEGTNRAAVHGVLGADSEVALRWQSRTAEAMREALVTVDCRSTVHLSPAALRYATELRYEVLQSRLGQARVALPSGHVITKLAGDLVKDWRVTPEANGAVLVVDFLRPVEGNTVVHIATEQPVPPLPGVAELRLPQPTGVQREGGSLRVAAEDLEVRAEASEGLRQVNALAREFAAYRFSGRPIALRLRLARVEPLVSVNARVSASLEESRLVISHELALNVSRAGIYTLALTPPPGFLVADVKGEGVEDWKMAEGKLRLSYAKRLLGDGKLTVQLEQPLSRLPPEAVLTPLRIPGAARESAFIGAGSVSGIQLKTAAVAGAREIPVSALPDRRGELLAFRAEAGDWRVSLAAERMVPRVVAEVFNLITIGDGLVGGSATVRFSIVNQGVQQFRLRLPQHWRNVEFTGANIRRKDQQGDIWTVALQDKAWGGYTLVLTYDFPFDPKQATLEAAGAHPLEVERETGTVAVTGAANLALQPGAIAEPLRQIDPTELAAADRAMVSRSVLLAYRYEGDRYALNLSLVRHEEVGVLDAVADRAQLASVLTASGEMLTQAGFMVKNNERQFQRFELPAGATLWGVTVNGDPIKAERDGNWVLVALPRGENRDQTFAIDLKYAQQLGALGGWWPRRLQLLAPKTDVPGTYVEWVLYAPASRHVSGFRGNMTVARGMDYGWRDGWESFVQYYRALWHDYGAGLIVGGVVVGFFVALFQHSRKRGFKGFFEVVVVFVLLAVLAGMMLPALSKAKAKAQRINSANNLKQIGVAARLFASDNNDRLPDSLDEMLPELGTPKVMLDPETGQRYTYLGAGKTESMPNAILAYSPERATGTREVLFADGSVLSLSAARFAEALAKDRAAAAPPPPTAPATAPVAQPAPGAQPGAQEKPPTVAAVATQAPVAAATTGTTASAPAPTASGIKSLKFDLPKAGRPYTFTRVLSLSNEPPTISFRLMSGRLFVFVRAALQLTAFLFGLALAAYQWRRAEPRSFRLAVGLALAALGTVDVLIAWRALGLGLIVGTPGLALVAVAWCIWRWRRRRPRPASKPPGGQALGVASAVVSLAVLWLWTQANDVRAAALPAPPLSIVSATYTGTASERAAQLEATLTFLASVTNQSAGLFGREVAVQEFVATSGEAILWRDGDRVGVRLPAPGSAAVRLKLLVKLSGEASQRQLDFGVPPALGSRLTLTVKEPEAEVEFPGAVSLRRQAQGDATVVEAVLGATNRVVLTWTPKRKRAADVATTVFAQQTALVTLGEGVMNTHAIMEWQVTQGELSVVRVRLPRSHRLLKVSGEHLRSWDFSETNREVLNLELVKPMAPMVRLVLDTEKPLENLPASLAVPLPEALEVKRQTGAVAVRGTEELSLSLRRAEGLERIDQAEFARTAGEVPSGVFGAWRFIRPDFDLQVQADVALPRLEAVVRQQFSVGLEQLSLVTHVDYTISRVGVFVLRLAVPPAWRVEAVQCDAMQTWSEQEETNRRWLEVRLEQRTLGPVSVLVRLRQSYTNLAPALDLAGLHPRDAEKLTGYVTVAAEAGVGLKTSALEGITEVPAAAVPGVAAGAAGLLAFKYVSTEPQAEAPWRLALATERLEPWLRAETATFVTVGETIVTGRTLVRYEIQNAPVREFRLRVPGAWRNVELAGAGVRRRDHTNGVWRVELQNKVAGEYRLTLHWELPRTNAATLTLAGAEALGVERETGVIGLLMQSQLQLETDTAAGQLLRIDARELPEWAASQSGGTPALSFRYLRPGWQLPLQVRRFENAAVLQALADQVRLRTVLADDGQQMTQLELSVRNNGRQNLALTLPPDAQLWSAFVDGRPVRPARRGTGLLLPLEGADNADVPVPIEVTFVGRAKFPHRAGTVELASPRLDVPLKDARWEVFLPPDFAYSHFQGTMTYESAELLPLTQDFTQAEYQRQEISKQESFTAQALELLRRTRSEMATGNLASASKLKGFRGAQLRDKQAAAELQRLEADVKRSQSGQLIQAQNVLNFDNLNRYGLAAPDQAGRAVAPANQVDYDAKVAEQQVAQLQKAQAVAEKIVAPLRVNLPTRGLRYAFVQVLQTETDKPLVIRLRAQSERDTGWFRRLLWGVSGLVALWIAVAVIVRLRPTRASAA